MINGKEQLRIGIVVPCDSPYTGGGYTIKYTIFQEILRRSKLSGESSKEVAYFFVVDNKRALKIWDLSSQDVIDICAHPLPYYTTCMIRFLLRRLFPKWPACWSFFPLSFTAGSKLKARLDVLWSLDSNIPCMNLPYIVTIWDLEHREKPFFPEFSSGGIWEHRERSLAKAINRSYLCISGSFKGAEDICLAYQKKPSCIEVIPFPISLDWSRQARTNRGLNDFAKYQLTEKGYLIYPAQFWPHKNHINLLLAIKELRSRGMSLELVLTGVDKTTRGRVIEYINYLKQNDYVHVIGFTAIDDLILLVKNSFALIYPSYFGPDNLPTIEAMSIGVPVFTSNNEGTYGQLGDGVFYFDPSDPEDICNSIFNVYDKKELISIKCDLAKKTTDGLTPYDYVTKLESRLIKDRGMLLSIR